MSESTSTGGGRRFIDLSKPIDLNTIIVLGGFLIGGLSMVLTMRADLQGIKAEVSIFESTTTHALDRLTDRVDHFNDSQHAAAR